MNRTQTGLAVGIAIVLVVIIVGVALLAPSTPPVSHKLKVVVTILPQKEFVERVGGDMVDVTVMVPPGESPHTYEPTPSQMQAVSNADIYFKVGSGLDLELIWLDQLLDMNPDMVVIDGAQNITINGTDPHIWLSPVNAMEMVRSLTRGLETMDSANATAYSANADAYIGELDSLDAEIRSSLANATRNSFMVYHPSWGYFAAEYGLEQIPVEEDGKEPTPQGLANLIQQAEDDNITIIFVPPEFSTTSAQTIADQIGGQVVYVDPLGENYLDNMIDVTAALEEALA